MATQIGDHVSVMLFGSTVLVGRFEERLGCRKGQGINSTYPYAVVGSK